MEGNPSACTLPQAQVPTKVPLLTWKQGGALAKFLAAHNKSNTTRATQQRKTMTANDDHDHDDDDGERRPRPRPRLRRPRRRPRPLPTTADADAAADRPTDWLRLTDPPLTLLWTLIPPSDRLTPTDSHRLSANLNLRLSANLNLRLSANLYKVDD